MSQKDQQTINNPQKYRDALLKPEKGHKVKPDQECHVYRDLKTLFPEEYEAYFDQTEKPAKKVSKVASIWINFSFYSNIVLLVLKIVAFALSMSMSVLASMVDSAMDIASGVVLFIAVRLAKKGIKSGNYQKTIHDAEANSKIKYLYAQRYESLGVLAFACIMGTLAVVLIYESINSIISISNGTAEAIVFDYLPMGIIIFTICLKFLLCMGCWYTSKKTSENAEALLAYRDDHRNDVLSNFVGLIGALLAFYLKGGWAYADPAASIVLCIYILINWAGKAVEQMKNLSGHKTEQAKMNEYMMRLIHQFMCSIFITEIEGFIGYTSGSKNVLEIRIAVPSTLTIAGSHQVCQTIQNVFENIEEIERCYIHIESHDCTNFFEEEQQDL